MSVIIVGAGGFGREMAGWMLASKAQIKGFIDDEKPGVLGTIHDYVPKLGEQLLVCISDPKGREAVVTSLMARKAVFHGFCASTLSPTAQYGTGTILCPTSLMSNDSTLGDFSIVNVFSSIGHDVQVGTFCTISSHVDLTGNVTVGDRCFFGSHAVVLPGVRIGNDCVIGAGAIVMRDVPDGATVYAQPARAL